MPHNRPVRAAIAVAFAFLPVTVLTSIVLALAWPVVPVNVNVRWTPGVTDAQRIDLERRFSLSGGERTEGTTWTYRLIDASTANIRALVEDARVEDTAHLNRIRFRPEFAQDRTRQIAAYSVAAGLIAAVVWLVMGAAIQQAVRASRPPPEELPIGELFFGAPVPPTSGARRPGARSYRVPGTAVAAAAGLTIAGALAGLGGASLSAAAGAIAVVYAAGFVVGSLLVARQDGAALAIIRTTAGMLLTTVAYLMSLVLLLPWFTGPLIVAAAALGLRGRGATRLPDMPMSFSADGVAAGALACIVIAPIAITYVLMAPGPFPPVFYNIDTAYALEKVHALASADVYPAWSLSNLGVRRTYHYGSQAMAALVSRSSGLLPHHALFLVVLPLLTAGVLAAAAAAARYLSPVLPRSLAVPLLLVSTPALSIPFWDSFGPQLWSALTSDALSIHDVVLNYDRWGILSNEGPNVGSDFVILGSIAGIAAAPSWGWTLPIFLIGSAVLVKTTAGIALMTGFILAEAWRRRLRPSPQMLAAAAVFAVVFFAFFVVAFENNFRVQIAPFDHIREMRLRGHASGIGVDLLWLLLPALIVGSAGIRNGDGRSMPFLLMAAGPLLVVNVSRMENIGDGGAGAGDDWFQILHATPFLFHAFALSYANGRWSGIGRWRRAAVLALTAAVIAPVIAAAASYTVMVARTPGSGNDFVDNRALAAALASIPVEGTVVVTNDLRYPAGQFTRDYRQMQIPALFGHQAYAVNYAHEAVDARRPLQELLRQTHWTDAIGAAAHEHGWTHFLIRKDYVHPDPIPLTRIFENEIYAVYRFP